MSCLVVQKVGTGLLYVREERSGHFVTMGTRIPRHCGLRSGLP
ncbi:MAG: hypothetical protein Q4D62_05380 [Planctomycetia bacterium]|nr:hypothetical protein [Planctomycetia bacterium]